MCPRNTAAPTRASQWWADGSRKLPGERDGEDPFPGVKREGEDPRALPRVRATFVAPMFPEPALRRSTSRSNAFATRMPNGMEPSR